MVEVDNATRAKIERKVKLFKKITKQIKLHINQYVDEIISNLEKIRKELLEEVEKKISENPFASFLSDLNNNDNITDKRLQEISNKKVLDSIDIGKKFFESLVKKVSFDQLCLFSHPLYKLLSQIDECADLTCGDTSFSWNDDIFFNKCLYEVESNLFSIRDKKPDTEYKARIHIVFSANNEYDMCYESATTWKRCKCGWKECPDVDSMNEYTLDKKNNRIATKNDAGSDKYCTVIGNMPFLLNKIISWNIKILKSEDNNGRNIYIGVAPFGINQNEDYNYKKCGWYFYCYESLLYSGSPHNYNKKEYGPRKGEGKYVHTGDSVGVVMNTIKGELSFVLKGVNYGVAYKGIPLDKPLVPCVLLGRENDSVELDTPKVEENVDISIPVSSSITAKSEEWNSIKLTWDAVKEASFYQIEWNGIILPNILTKTKFTKRGLLPESEYSFKVRTVTEKGVSKWSAVGKGKTVKRPFESSWWKECPDVVGENHKYFVDKNYSRIAKTIGSDWCAIVGNTPIPLPPNEVTSWNIKILKSQRNDGYNIYVGVSPSDIDQNEEYNFNNCGWYFYCYDSILHSGLPHNYRGKEYGPRKKMGEYIHTGDNVGVVMDTTNGELSFVLNRVNYGVAYKGIPLDKPIVPCVLLKNGGDSVEFDPSEEEKTKLDVSIHIPSNITLKSGTWDSINLTWDAVEGASFYLVEVGENKSCYASKSNVFTKRGLLPDTEYNFRVRTVKDNKVSEWSNIVNKKTKDKSFENSGWEECPGGKYSIDENNTRIASKIGDDDWTTIIGKAQLPPNKVTSWNIKILKSEKNDGGYIYIGVAPFNIEQNKDDNRYKCGWYFDCYYSKLRSGPHNYDKEYGPRKEKYGQYVHTGDSVGVVMNTMKGELSFVLNRVNYGVAYEGIPLDKPLVPCVLLKHNGDSVKLKTTKFDENLDNSIPVPSNITIKSETWDSINLTWDVVVDASFYQIEVDEKILPNILIESNFAKRGLPPDTEYNFKVRTVKENKVSEWSNVVKGRTQKESFKFGWWKECPGDVDKKRKYSVDGNNPRIATMTGVPGYSLLLFGGKPSFCTIIWNTQLPVKMVTSWNIKILKSRKNDGNGIFIGVAPFDINQNEPYNYNKCGWYFDCHVSTLSSGPPHKYAGKAYGPRKEKGKCVNTGDSVGVVMDTVNGELSFVLSDVNLGVAYEEIPLDKPLVSCVILKEEGDSVELIHQ